MCVVPPKSAITSSGGKIHITGTVRTTGVDAFDELFTTSAAVARPGHRPKEQSRKELEAGAYAYVRPLRLLVNAEIQYESQESGHLLHVFRDETHRVRTDAFDVRQVAQQLDRAIVLQ